MAILAPVGAWWDGLALNVVLGLAAFGFITFGLSIWERISTARAHTRQATLEVFCDANGLGVAKAGQALWSLEWSQFGGYRRVLHKVRAAGSREKAGLEVLTLDGQVAGFIPAFLCGQTKATVYRTEMWRAFLRELNRHCPNPGDIPEPVTAFQRATPKSAARNMAIGLALAIPTGWALSKVLSFWRTGEASESWVRWLAHSGRISILLPPLFVGLAVALWGVSSLLLKKAAVAELKSNQGGEAIDANRVEVLHRGGKVRLVEGQTYQYLDPDWIHQKLNQTIIPAKIMLALIVLIALLATVIPSKGEPIPIYVGVALAAIVVAWVAFCVYTVRLYADLQRNLFDRIVSSREKLIVHKASGERWEFILPRNSEFRLPIRGQFNIKTLRGSVKRKYRMDPTYLVPRNE